MTFLGIDVGAITSVGTVDGDSYIRGRDFDYAELDSCMRTPTHYLRLVLGKGSAIMIPVAHIVSVRC